MTHALHKSKNHSSRTHTSRDIAESRAAFQVKHETDLRQYTAHLGKTPSPSEAPFYYGNMLEELEGKAPDNLPEPDFFDLEHGPWELKCYSGRQTADGIWVNAGDITIGSASRQESMDLSFEKSAVYKKAQVILLKILEKAPGPDGLVEAAFVRRAVFIDLDKLSPARRAQLEEDYTRIAETIVYQGQGSYDNLPSDVLRGKFLKLGSKDSKGRRSWQFTRAFVTEMLSDKEETGVTDAVPRVSPQEFLTDAELNPVENELLVEMIDPDRTIRDAVIVSDAERVKVAPKPKVKDVPRHNCMLCNVVLPVLASEDHICEMCASSVQPAVAVNVSDLYSFEFKKSAQVDTGDLSSFYLNS